MSSLPTGPARKPTGAGISRSGAATAALAREVRRLADRYRHLSESRLTARLDPDDPSDPERTRADAGLALARRLAALGDAPPGHEVPALGAFAVGDQIAVTGLDLVAYLDRVPESEAEPLLGEALDAVRGLATRV